MKHTSSHNKTTFPINLIENIIQYLYNMNEIFELERRKIAPISIGELLRVFSLRATALFFYFRSTKYDKIVVTGFVMLG